MAWKVITTVEFIVPGTTEDYKDPSVQKDELAEEAPTWGLAQWATEIKRLFENEHHGLTNYSRANVISVDLKEVPG